MTDRAPGSLIEIESRVTLFNPSPLTPFSPIDETDPCEKCGSSGLGSHVPTYHPARPDRQETHIFGRRAVTLFFSARPAYLVWRCRCGHTFETATRHDEAPDAAR